VIEKREGKGGHIGVDFHRSASLTIRKTSREEMHRKRPRVKEHVLEGVLELYIKDKEYKSAGEDR